MLNNKLSADQLVQIYHERGKRKDREIAREMGVPNAVIRHAFEALDKFLTQKRIVDETTPENYRNALTILQEKQDVSFDDGFSAQRENDLRELESAFASLQHTIIDVIENEAARRSGEKVVELEEALRIEREAHKQTKERYEGTLESLKKQSLSGVLRRKWNGLSRNSYSG